MYNCFINKYEVKTLKTFFKNTNQILLIPTIIIAVISILLIVIVLFKNFKYYKKHNIILFTTKKITIMGMFFALFLLQSFLTSFQALDHFIFLNFDSATVILIAFLFGPIEAFFYALIADTTRILIVQGWIWQLLYALQFPLLGLIAGNVAFKYKKMKTKENVSQNNNFQKHIFLDFFFIQGMFLLLFFFSAIYGYLNRDILKGIVYQTLILTSFFSILFYELIFFLLIKRNQYEKIALLKYLLFIAVIYRLILGNIFSSVADVNLWAPSFKYVFIPRLLKSSYIIPSYLLTWYFLINLSTKFNKKNKDNYW